MYGIALGGGGGGGGGYNNPITCNMGSHKMKVTLQHAKTNYGHFHVTKHLTHGSACTYGTYPISRLLPCINYYFLSTID